MVRLIIKITHQPPIDTPASVTWSTIDIKNNNLELLLKTTQYNSAVVIGSELISEDE